MSITKTRLFEAIFGEEFCNAVDQLGDDYSTSCWYMGRRTLEAIHTLASIKSQIARGEVNSEYAEYMLSFGIMDVYAQMALRLHVPQRTLRDYCSVVEYYSEDDRARFGVLPFSHFRFAKSYSSTEYGNLSIKILELSLKAMDMNNGRPPSVDWLEVNLWRVKGNIVEKLGEVEAVQEFDAIASTIMTSDFEAEGTEQDGETNNETALPYPIYYFVNSLKAVLLNLKKRIPEVEAGSQEENEIAVEVEELIDVAIKISDKINQMLLAKKTKV